MVAIRCFGVMTPERPYEIGIVSIYDAVEDSSHNQSIQRYIEYLNSFSFISKNKVEITNIIATVVAHVENIRYFIQNLVMIKVEVNFADG